MESSLVISESRMKYLSDSINKKDQKVINNCGRGERTRTFDLTVPNRAR